MARCTSSVRRDADTKQFPNTEYAIPHAVLAAQIARRREAALRLPPIGDAFIRDPLERNLDATRRPSTFGLGFGELIAEARRLRANGWAPWEIAEVLVRPAELGVAA